jgi:hypothetical protein
MSTTSIVRAEPVIVRGGQVVECLTWVEPSRSGEGGKVRNQRVGDPALQRTMLGSRPPVLDLRGLGRAHEIGGPGRGDSPAGYGRSRVGLAVCRA